MKILFYIILLLLCVIPVFSAPDNQTFFLSISEKNIVTSVNNKIDQNNRDFIDLMKDRDDYYLDYVNKKTDVLENEVKGELKKFKFTMVVSMVLSFIVAFLIALAFFLRQYKNILKARLE